MTQPRAYLDWNATAPLEEAAQAAMRDVWAGGALNPSSRHMEGQRARALLETARKEMASLLGCMPDEIVFTSGGTEADNMAVRGAPVERLLVSLVEHPAVMRAAKTSSLPVEMLEVDAEGVVDLIALENALKADSRPALVCLMLANNETGVIEPVRQAAEIAHAHGALVHCDAVQGMGKIEVNFTALGVDTLALSAHKFGGPNGVGALIVREGVALEPLVHGGGQERSRRGGTENVAGVVGMAAALKAAMDGLAEKEPEIRRLRDKLEKGLREISPAVVIFSAQAPRIDNTTCFALAGMDAATALMNFDLDGVAISAGSACHSGKAEASRVLIAMGVDRELAKCALRASLGPATTDGDIRLFLDSWRRQVERMDKSAA